MNNDSIVKFKSEDKKRHHEKNVIKQEPVFIHKESVNLKELLILDNFAMKLSRNFIFIHNKKGMVERLLIELERLMNKQFHFVYINLHSVTLADLKKRISVTNKSKPVIFILKNTSINKNIHNLCTYIYSKKNTCGVWLCDYIYNYLPSTITLFHILYMIYHIKNMKYYVHLFQYTIIF